MKITMQNQKATSISNTAICLVPLSTFRKQGNLYKCTQQMDERTGTKGTGADWVISEYAMNGMDMYVREFNPTCHAGYGFNVDLFVYIHSFGRTLNERRRRRKQVLVWISLPFSLTLRPSWAGGARMGQGAEKTFTYCVLGHWIGEQLLLLLRMGGFTHLQMGALKVFLFLSRFDGSMDDARRGTGDLKSWWRIGLPSNTDLSA